MKPEASGPNPVVLCIAGYDPTGGAGLLADTAALCSLGIRAAGVVTAMTRQRPNAPASMTPRDAAEVSESACELIADLKPAAVKVGMVATQRNAEQIARALAQLPSEIPVVLDPVLKAGAGGDLAARDVAAALTEYLIPGIMIVTPNLGEAEILTGRPVRNPDEMEQAAVALRQLGARYVLVTGGHLSGDPVDMLVGPDETLRLPQDRINVSREVHGTGCMLSSLIAGYLVLGHSVAEAVRAATIKVRAGIAQAWPPGEDGWMFTGSIL